MTDPVTQAVVDWVWIYDCITKSELQGPPNWGGRLLRPKEPEPAITRDKAKKVALAIFGQPQDVEHETVTGEPDAMQLDPAPAAGRSGATSGDDTQEEEPRGRQMTGSNNQGPRTELEKSPKDLARDEVKRLIEKEKRFRTFSSDDIQILVDRIYEIESTKESAEGWLVDFAADHQSHSLDSWRDFYRNRKAVINKCVKLLLSANPEPGVSLRPLRDPPAAPTSRYRNRSRSGGRSSNRSLLGSGGQTLGTTQGAQASERPPTLSGGGPLVQPKKPGRPRKNPASEQGGLPQIPRQAKKNGTVGRPQRSSSRIRPASGTQVASTATPSDQGPAEVSSFSDSDALTAMRFFSSYSEAELLAQEHTIPSGRKSAFDAFMRGQIGADPTRSPGSEGNTWTSRLKNDWDVISAGALALKGQAALNRTGAQNQLSHPSNDFTADDYDEMADFIATQIRARRVAERRETSGLMENSIWKAFAIVYQTFRRWEDWQTYYRERAEAINNTARKRLEEKSLADQLDVIMEQLATSGRLNTPPPSGVLKRPPEGQLDERRSKQLRL